MIILFWMLGFTLEIIVSSFVFSTLWGWFIVPLGVMALTIPHAAGIITLITGIKGINIKDDSDHEEFGKAVVLKCVMLVFLSVIGFVLHCFM